MHSQQFYLTTNTKNELLVLHIYILFLISKQTVPETNHRDAKRI